MRFDRRALRASVAVVAVGGALTLGVLAGVRWTAAGEPLTITPPAGADERLPEGGYEPVIDNEASDVHRTLESDRGSAEVGTYAVPPATTWDDVSSVVAGQLGEGWQRFGDCADTGKRVITCRWEEPSRWWPRSVQVVLMRPPADRSKDDFVWPDNKFLIIGAGRG
ncbi:hypothetical protein ACQP2E_10905 [Actinoplanes sp. CA-015351]|uniref:hypothetical protein n=1 Tax=Actinoplanes sp. CA-015351 TaxID=3239897 RepID=UPI003D992126